MPASVSRPGWSCSGSRGRRGCGSSPSATVQCFTAIGEVTGEAPWEREFPGGTVLWVRDVAWRAEAREVPIRPLLETLSWVKNPGNWGFYMRGSSREISGEDFAAIAGAMLGGDV